MSFLFSVILGWAALAPPAVVPSEAPSDARILVVYYSETGHTKALGEALTEGIASVEGVDAVFREISQATDDDIRRADGILVGTPVYWASLHARVKDFVDQVGRVLDGETHGEGRTAGAFCTGGAPASGKELARLTILSAFLNMRFVVIGGVELDAFGNLGSEATTGPSDPGVSEQELEAARRTGARFARITAEMKRGRVEP